ncbi:MAG: hypothetical protein Q8P82_02440 [bacterium]|nr:hypothetical protein [bacterium]
MTHADRRPEVEPLLIRGDRLLLALDVIRWAMEIDFAAIHRTETRNPNGFRRGILFVPFGGAFGRAIELLHLFVEGHREQLASIEFDIDRLFFTLEAAYSDDRSTNDYPLSVEYARQGKYVRTTIREFFERVASGELTEAVFKKRHDAL